MNYAIETLEKELLEKDRMIEKIVGLQPHVSKKTLEELEIHRLHYSQLKQAIKDLYK